MAEFSSVTYKPLRNILDREDTFSQEIKRTNSHYGVLILGEDSKGSIVSQLEQIGTNVKYLEGIPLNHLFLPEYGCHLEIKRDLNGACRAYIIYKKSSFSV